MTRSRYRIFETEYPYFLTCTVVDWIPLFLQPRTVTILLDCLTFLQQAQRIELYGYVIMENHLHLIASAPDLAQQVARFKSFTAKEIVSSLHQSGQTGTLRQLAVSKLDHKRDRKHQVWQEGSHPEQIQGRHMFEQKLHYIHENPVRRGYVDAPEHWRYSSARDYAGATGLIPLTVLLDR